jgi:hypothetical protein
MCRSHCSIRNGLANYASVAQTQFWSYFALHKLAYNLCYVWVFFHCIINIVASNVLLHIQYPYKITYNLQIM